MGSYRSAQGVKGQLWGVIAPLRELKANTFMYIVGATIGF